MVKQMAEKLSRRLVANNVITMEDRRFYTYGLELILNDILIFVVIAVISVVTNTIGITAIFTVVFCVLRAFTGGYHSKSYLGCFCITLLNYLAMLWVVSNLDAAGLAVGCGMMLLATAVIWRLAPIEHRNNPFGDGEKKKYRRISRILSLILVFLYVISIAFFPSEIMFTISWSVFATAVLMLLAIIVQKKEGTANEEKAS
ncbi:hypothetical protein AMQ83_23580 [Paenibacillus riograndensis]|nr:hypothetical protein AMQ83_23580 [Paenibacillus riograndensis]